MSIETFFLKLAHDFVAFIGMVKTLFLNLLHSIYNVNIIDSIRIFFESDSPNLAFIFDLFVKNFPFRVKEEFKFFLQTEESAFLFIFFLIFGISAIYFYHINKFRIQKRANISSLEGCFEQYVELVRTKNCLLVNGATFCTSENKRFAMNFIFPSGNLSNNALDFIKSHAKGIFFVDKEHNFFRVWAYVFPDTANPARTSLSALLKPQEQSSSSGFLKIIFSFLFFLFLVVPFDCGPIVLAIKWSMLILYFCLFLFRKKIKNIFRKNFDAQRKDFESRLCLLDKYDIPHPLL